MAAAFAYPIALAAISVLVVALEYFFPDREQKQLRPALGWDLLHLVFNGHFLGVIFFGVASTWILPHIDQLLGSVGLVDAVYRNSANSWPMWAQIVVALVVVDFIQWCVHNALHRIPVLWETHKCHHSVEDGEMDWIVSFRFQWTEVAIYRAVLYLPLAWFGFSAEAVLFHAIFGTLIGHLNHANLKISWGPLRYVLNSPKMHIWHHDYEGDTHTTKNFGIIFSTWDWIFGTAYMPEEPPKRLGFPGVEEFPKNFLAAQVWPLQHWIKPLAKPLAASVAGVVLLAGAWFLHDPPTASSVTPMLGEPQASSQPASDTVASLSAYAATATEASAAVGDFGTEAATNGFAHPEAMVSVGELAAALGAEQLVLLDVRPEERFSEGHIPSATRLYRPDYSSSEPIPGMSRRPAELESMLRRLGVDEGDVVVAYTDGGPEAYRLWWTLRTVAGVEVRVLDGGLQQWVAQGHGLAEGAGLTVEAGGISVGQPEGGRVGSWEDVQQFLDERSDVVLLDTRESPHFSGEEVSSRASRGGHIPEARLLEWWRIVRDTEGDHRLATPDTLRSRFATVDVTASSSVVAYCQSGTRSAATLFALHQLGWRNAVNYDGSWAEYSRLDLPAAR